MLLRVYRRKCPEGGGACLACFRVHVLDERESQYGRVALHEVSRQRQQPPRVETRDRGDPSHRSRRRAMGELATRR